MSAIVEPADAEQLPAGRTRLSPDEVAAAYARYQRPILAFCTQRLNDPAAAEDCASAVWEDFVRKAPAYEDRGHPVSTLLFHIARNKCVDHVRLSTRRPASVLVDCHRAPDVFGEVEATIDAAALLAALGRRQPRWASVLVGKVLGHTNAELAAQLGVSVGIVKALVHRAQAAARKAEHAR